MAIRVKHGSSRIREIMKQAAVPLQTHARTQNPQFALSNTGFVGILSSVDLHQSQQ